MRILSADSPVIRKEVADSAAVALALYATGRPTNKNGYKIFVVSEGIVSASSMVDVECALQYFCVVLAKVIGVLVVSVFEVGVSDCLRRSYAAESIIT